MEKPGNPLRRLDRSQGAGPRAPITRALLVLLATLLLGAACYVLYFQSATRPVRAIACAQDAELQWLRKEFSLDGRQFSQVAALHEAYEPKCKAMCAEILQANRKLETLLRASQGVVTPEIKSAMADVTAADLACRENMLEHIYAVSREMSPDSGTRYRKMMETDVLRFDMRHTALAPSPL